jgi:hypothetical protein
MANTPGVSDYPSALDTTTTLLTAVNSAATALDGDILIGTTTIPVLSTALFPSSGFITIDDEIIRYSGKTSSSFTGCTRGVGGTTASAHSDDAVVEQRIIAQFHNVLANALILVETELDSTKDRVTTLEGVSAITTLEGLNDTDVEADPASNSFLVYNGTKWEDHLLVAGDLPTHSHATADVTGLDTALASKASTSHTHVIGDTTGLQTALDGKASTVHTHSIANVTGLQTELTNLDGRLDTLESSSSTTFLDLIDTPDSYTSQAGKFIAVNGAADGLEFVDAPTTSSTITVAESDGTPLVENVAYIAFDGASVVDSGEGVATVTILSGAGDLKSDGTVPMTGNLDLGGNVVSNTSGLGFADNIVLRWNNTEQIIEIWDDADESVIKQILTPIHIHISGGTVYSADLWAAYIAGHTPTFQQFVLFTDDASNSRLTYVADNTLGVLKDLDIDHLDAENIGDGSVTNTEFGYLANVTDDIQSQIDGKMDAGDIGGDHGHTGTGDGGGLLAPFFPTNVSPPIQGVNGIYLYSYTNPIDNGNDLIVVNEYGPLNISRSFASKSQNLADLADIPTARTNLGWVAGSLPLSLGGTGLTSMAVGDLLYYSTGDTLSVLSGNINGDRRFLFSEGSGGAATAPSYGLLIASDLPAHTHAYTDITNFEDGVSVYVGSMTLDAFDDVQDYTTLTPGNVLKVNPVGSGWYADALTLNEILGFDPSIGGSTGDYIRMGADGWTNSVILAGDIPTGIDAANISGGLVSNTIFDYLANVTGDIQAQIDAITTPSLSLDDLTDVVVGSPSNNDFIYYSTGTGKFINGPLTYDQIPTGIDATHIATGIITNTEYEYLNNLTGNIQTQLNGKAASSHTHSASDIASGLLALARGGTNADLSATGGTANVLKQLTVGGAITVAALTAAEMPSGISATKIGANTNVSDTEYGYLDGVTSAIQTQLNAKQPRGSYALTDGTTIAVDWNNGPSQYVTIQATGRTVTFSNPVEGARYLIAVTQGSGGSKTITTWPTITWQGGSAPTLTTAAGKTDLITLVYVNGVYYGNYSLNY